MNFFPDPEEMQRSQERLVMEADAEMHQLIRVVDSLDRDQTEALRKLFQTIRMMGHPNSAIYVNFFVGYLAAKLQRDHDVCAACAKHHGEQLAEAEQS